MILQCPSCKTEFVPPPGYFERQRERGMPITCPICYMRFEVAEKEADDDRARQTD